MLGEWGPSGRRVVNADWKQPRRWDRKAAREGVRRRVFPSLCDPFEESGAAVVTSGGSPLTRGHFQECFTPEQDRESWGLDELRFEFFNLVRATPSLDWLVLTKRPEDAARMMRPFLEAWDIPCLPNLWLGVSVEDQEYADERIPELLKIPAAVRWVSYEPALGPVDFAQSIPCGYYCDESIGHVDHGPNGNLGHIDWVVVGGESGPGARPFDLAWARSTIRQCREAVVACYVKQLGANAFSDRISITGPGSHGRYWPTDDPKGADPSEWPEDIRVQEMPR